jgi:hypothetical protein
MITDWPVHVLDAATSRASTVSRNPLGSFNSLDAFVAKFCDQCGKPLRGKEAVAEIQIDDFFYGSQGLKCNEDDWVEARARLHDFMSLNGVKDEPTDSEGEEMQVAEHSGGSVLTVENLAELNIALLASSIGLPHATALTPRARH